MGQMNTEIFQTHVTTSFIILTSSTFELVIDHQKQVSNPKISFFKNVFKKNINITLAKKTTMETTVYTQGTADMESYSRKRKKWAIL